MNATIERKKVRINTFNNSWYQPGPKWKIYLWYFVNTLFFNNHFNPFIGIKVFLLRIFGAKVGKHCYIKPGVNIKYAWNLNIGDYVLIGENVWIDNLDTVTLQDHCTISQGATILTGSHNYKKTSFDLIIKPVTIEESVWICSKAIVCPGIICKSHSVLTTGSVAQKDLELYTIYTGHPAEPVRERIIE
jgi:putative colanic acid biosynthesis acetyltransferase WcaF